MSAPPDLSTVLQNLITALANIVSGIATAISENAALIGTVVVMGLAFYAIYRYAGSTFRAFTGWLRGLM